MTNAVELDEGSILTPHYTMYRCDMKKIRPFDLTYQIPKFQRSISNSQYIFLVTRPGRMLLAVNSSDDNHYRNFVTNYNNKSYDLLLTVTLFLFSADDIVVMSANEIIEVYQSFSLGHFDGLYTIYWLIHLYDDLLFCLSRHPFQLLLQTP